MNRNMKSLIAVTSLVIGGLLGINIMVNKESESGWTMWTFIFLFGAVLFWLWIMREDRATQDKDGDEAMRAAEDRLKSLETAARKIKDDAEQVIKSTESSAKVQAPTVPTPKAVPSEPIVKTESPKVQATAPTPKPIPSEPIVKTAPKVSEPSKADDLTRIEGIGPKYAEILAGAGINTFAKLATMNTDEIVELVKKGGGRKSASMETWQEQAKLASAGDWDALSALQANLTGGRKS